MARGLRGRGVPVSITIRVGVPGGGPGKRRILTIDERVTIIIVVVADLVRSRVHIGRSIVTVGIVLDHPRRRDTREGSVAGESIPVTIDVVVPIDLAGLDLVLIVGQPVAVIIEPVADLVGVRMNCSVGIITIRAGLDRAFGLRTRDHEVVGIPEPLLIIVRVPRGRVSDGRVVIVREPVTVVVDPVADLLDIRSDRLVPVITVGAVRHVAARLTTLPPLGRRVPEAVAIEILVPLQSGHVGIVVVDESVPVVVEPIAAFDPVAATEQQGQGQRQHLDSA